MSRFFKDLVKNANKLYYGDTKAAAVGKKIENFADYLGDRNYRDEDLNPSQSQTKNNGQQNSRREREREPEVNDEPEVIERETPPPQKASIPFMITRQMKLDLIELGYSVDDIKNFTPIEAHRVLQEKDRK